MITVLNNGKPVYYPQPGLKLKEYICWSLFYCVICTLAGVKVALALCCAQTVIIPFGYGTFKKFRCTFHFFHLIQIPLLKHENPKDFDLHGARNLIISHESKVDNCSIDLGVWHVLPKTVYKQNQERIDNISKEEKNKLFDDEIRNTNFPVVLYCHGITYSRALPHRVELYNLLQDLDVHVVTFDYRGYADSTLVTPSRDGVSEDVMTVYSWIRDLVGNEKPVFLWGHSLGSAVALHTVSQLGQLSRPELPPPRALVLEASFNNIYEAMEDFPVAKIFNWLPYFHHTMVGAIVKHPDVRFLPEEDAVTMTSPGILMLHAKDDNILPYLLATKLYGHISRSRKNEEERPIFKMFPSGKHTYICRDKTFPRIIREFIEKYKQMP